MENPTKRIDENRPIFCPFKAPYKESLRVGREFVETLRFDHRPGMTLVCCKLPPLKNAELWPNSSYLQIAFLHKGRLDVVDEDGTDRGLKSGDWFLIKPAASLFKIHPRDKCTLHWIEFDEISSQSLMGFSSSLHSSIKSRETPFFTFGDTAGPLRSLGSEISNFKGIDSKERMIAEAKTLEWLAHLLDHSVFSPCKAIVPNAQLRDDHALESARRLLENRLSETHTLASISREIHLNEFKLKKGFKEKFGRTVFGYLRQKRMEHAQEMLLSGTTSVIEVANSVGYSNASHFARAFKEEFSINPSETNKSFTKTTS